MTPHAALVPAELAARYRPRRLLGEGAFGVVLEAEDVARGDAVALKIFKGGAGEARDRFLREARLAAKVRHPNVVSVRDAGEVAGTAFLVSEMITGGDLEARLRADGSLAPEEVEGLARDLLQGLAAIHGAGIVHRDLKPANVLVHGEGRHTITDFGMGRGGGEATMTATGQILGTPKFMAPEQFEGLEPTEPSDLYALGLILYQTATGEPPHPTEGGMGAMMSARMAGTHVSLRERGGASPGLAALVDSLLEPERDQRPQDAAAALRLLDGAASDRPAGASSEALVSSTSQVRRSGAFQPLSGEVTGEVTDRWAAPGSRRGALVAVAVLALGLLGGYLAGAREPQVPVAVTSTPVVSEFAGTRALVQELRVEARGDDGIREGAGITAETATEDAVSTWTRARVRFRRLAQEAQLKRLLAELSGAPFDAATHEAVVDLARFEAVLDTSVLEDIPPLWAPGEDPELAGFLARTFRVEPIPALQPSPEKGVEPLPRELDALGRSFGGAWVAVRRKRDLPTLPGRDGQPYYDQRVKFQNLDGVVFANPIASVRAELQILVRKVDDVDRAEAPPEARFPLRTPVTGDLELALMLRDCLRQQAVQVEILGREERLAWVGVAPVPEGLESDSTYRAPLRLRVAASRLPEGAREVRVTGLGTQAVRPPNDFFRLGNAYQRLQAPEGSQ